jgi:hypothetical protein
VLLQHTCPLPGWHNACQHIAPCPTAASQDAVKITGAADRVCGLCCSGSSAHNSCSATAADSIAIEQQVMVVWSGIVCGSTGTQKRDTVITVITRLMHCHCCSQHRPIGVKRDTTQHVTTQRMLMLTHRMRHLSPTLRLHTWLCIRWGRCVCRPECFPPSSCRHTQVRQSQGKHSP